jgi:hypothetical protein
MAKFSKSEVLATLREQARKCYRRYMPGEDDL